MTATADWEARALESLRACCAARGRAVTKDEFMVWGRERRPRIHPEKMGHQRSWLLWLAEAGYPPTVRQLAAAGRRVTNSRAEQRRRARAGDGTRACLNAPDCAEHPN